MTLYAVQRAIYRLKKDEVFNQEFRHDAVTALKSSDLSPDERDALVAGDIAGLYQMGVHPLLLAPYARVMGIPRPRYQQLLEPLRGRVRMQSRICTS